MGTCLPASANRSFVEESTSATAFEQAPVPADPLHLGMRVEARYEGGEYYYPGKIIRVHPAPSSGYDISYDDGDFEACVGCKNLKLNFDELKHLTIEI